MSDQNKISQIRLINLVRRDLFYCVSINQEGNTMLVANNRYITFFKLFRCNGLLKKISKIYVCAFTIQFMHNSNSFISIGYTHQILFWNEDNQLRWSILQKIQGSLGMSFYLSKNDSLFLIGGQDGIIKCWDREQEWKCSQTIQVYDSIRNLIMDEMENLIIILQKKSQQSENSFVISILKKDQDCKWFMFQKISEADGISLCNIGNYQFAYLPFSEKEISIYQFNVFGCQFEYKKSLKLPQYDSHSVSRMNFIQSEDYLMIGTQQNLHFIKMKSQSAFSQKLCLQKHDFKQLSQNGKFLIMLLSQYKYLQIQKLRISQ